MQALKAERSAGQNFYRMSWRGEPSSSLAKLARLIITALSDLLDDGFVGEGRLSFGTTEVVDHVFHRHFLGVV